MLRLLDLFCGAGGCSMGYHRAGFEVIGVDINPQPRYPFEFHQADALTFPLGGFDVIHASPPCQAYCKATAWRGNRADHLDLIDPVRERLIESGLPYVIENVNCARKKLRQPVMLCGTMFGLAFQRHRWFELRPKFLLLTGNCRHSKEDFSFDHGGKQPESVYRSAIGCHWMSILESRQAIPPSYTEYIGRQLILAIGGKS